MKQKMIYLALTLCMFSAVSVKSQVLIGGNENDDPHEGAVLDLSQTANLGLLLPQIFLVNVSDWQLSGNEANGEGMLIYNTNDDVPGGNGKDIYVWIGNTWKPVGLVIFKSFSLDKNLLFLDPDGEKGTITAQNFTGSDSKPFDDVTVSWSIVADDKPEDAHISYIDNTATVTPGSTTGSFTVQVTANGITQDCVITIGECAGVMDAEGHAYYAAEFGAAGCWMTQNLRSTYTTDNEGKTINQLKEDGAPTTSPALKYYWYPGKSASVEAATAAAILDSHPEYGLLYTWAAATGRTGVSNEERQGMTNAGDSEGIQGICPTGWHIPSDREWNELEKEIANSVEGTYGSGPTTPWEVSWETAHGAYRPSSGDGHGTIMISTVAVNGRTTNGTSKPRDAGGFDALLVGRNKKDIGSGYSTHSILWTSSSINPDVAALRSSYYLHTGVWYGGSEKYDQLSVRCKKD